MARIGDSHRLTLVNEPGLRVALVDDLEDLARALWLGARHAVEATNGTVKIRSGAQGVEGPVNMRNLMAGLLPEASSDEVSTVTDMCRQLLRKTTAAICIDSGRHHGDPQTTRTTPIWWVADALPSDFSLHAAYVRDNGKHAQELRLIQEQARAIRGPLRVDNSTSAKSGPVTTTQRPTPAEEPVTTTTQFRTVTNPPTPSTDPRILSAFEQARLRRQEESQRWCEEVFTIVKQAREPMAAEEVDALVSKDGRTGKETLSSTRDYLKRLKAEGKIFSRQETREERMLRAGGSPARAMRAQLWFPREPVPARVTGELVPGVRLGSAQDFADKERQARREQLEKQARRANAKLTTEEVADRLVSFLTTGGAWSRNALADATGLRRSAVSEALRYLADADLIKQDDRGLWVCNDGSRPALQEPARPLEGSEAVKLQFTRQNEAFADRMLQLFRRYADQQTVWSQRDVLTALDLPKGKRNSIVRAGELLIERGLVRKSPKFVELRWELVPAETAPEPKSDGPTADTDTQLPAPGVDDKVNRIMELVGSLVAESGDAKKVAELEKRNAELQREVERLTRANRGLSQALTAMQES